MSDHGSTIIQAVIAMARVIIAVNCPAGSERPAETRASAATNGQHRRPSFVVAAPSTISRPRYLARCIALKTQDARLRAGSKASGAGMARASR